MDAKKNEQQVTFEQIVTGEVSRRMGALVVENINLSTQLELLKMKLKQMQPPAEAEPVPEGEELFVDKTNE